jgi:hypothetical protein
MHIYRILKRYDYNENLTDEHFRVFKLRQNQQKDDGWTTIVKVNKKEEMEKLKREERRKRQQKRREECTHSYLPF